jgi:succinoglycan biosynthesis transport protein ExoP
LKQMPKIEMNLTDYLRVIRKRKRIIALSFILVFASTIYYTSKQTPVYSTSCKVKIEQRKSVAEILTELVTWSPGDEMASQANIITSYEVVRKAALKLGYIYPNMPEEKEMQIVKGYQGQIATEQIERTNIIAITATSSNPEVAARLVNTVAEVYRETHFENKKKEASNVRKFVEEQLDNYSAQLQKSQDELQKFRQENPLVQGESTAANAPFQTNARIASLENEIVKSELDLIGLKSKYTDLHPQVISLKRKLTKSKQDLSSAIAELAAEQKELSGKEIRLAQLKRNVAMNQDLYQMFNTKHEEARILEAEKAEDVSIIEKAMIPGAPIKPNKNLNMIIGIFSGLLIGLIMAFVSESLDTTIGRIDDIEELLKVPVLGIIPHTGLEKGKTGLLSIFKKEEKISDTPELHKKLVALFDPTSVAGEAYKSLRTNLDLTGLRKVGNAIVITSSAPQEGKTQTLCNLGVSMAQAGQRVILIGSDFRKPMIYKLFGLKRSPGLSEILIGKAPWRKVVNTATDILLGGLEYERILKTPGIENLHIITCGERTPNPAELLSFSEMDDLIQELKQEFDVVLFDSSPTLPVTDSAILGAKADGVILVYQAGKTARQALFRSKIQLENVDVKVIGVVINNLKAKYIEDVTPYQRYRYYGYYGEKREK